MTLIKVHGQRVPEADQAIEVEGWKGDIESLLQKVIEASPSLSGVLLTNGKLRTDLGILVNGRHCMFMDGLKTFISESDRIDVLLPVIGG